jgi:hypothetical protein
LVGFQTMVIVDPYGITFNAVGFFGLDFQLLFKSGSSYCDCVQVSTDSSIDAAVIAYFTTHTFQS